MSDKVEIKFKNGSTMKWLESNGTPLRGYQSEVIHFISQEGEKEDSSLARDNTKKDRTF